MHAMELQGPLLHPSGGVSGVELAARLVNEGNALARVQVTRMRWREQFIGIGLAAAFLRPSMPIVYIVFAAWQKNP